MADGSALTCPNCGAALETTGDQAEITCHYCGTLVMVPHAAPPPPPTEPSRIVIPLETIDPVGTRAGTKAMWIITLVIVLAVFGFVGVMITSITSSVSHVTDSVMQPLNAVLTAVPSYQDVMTPPTDAPEPTRAPRPTETPRPTSTPQPTLPAYAKLVLKDDFTDPKSGWDRTTVHGNSMNYTDSGYLISIGGANDGESSWIKDGLKDVSVEVDEETQSGSGWYGVMCRVKEGVGGYSFEVNTDGEYAIEKYIFTSDGTTSKEIASGSLNPDVLKQSGINHVRGDCIGKTLTLTVNGQVIDRGADSSFSAGGVGLVSIASSDSANGLDTLFQKFVVRSP